jgi:uncharacterized circularly permuted ATP-grasp superfamily protein/uncharacterized alpha-E superfamily protein
MSSTTANLIYQPLAGHYDEMMAKDGSVRPHWQPLVSNLDELGTRELKRRTQEAQRIVRDHGTTYHIHQDRPRGTDRPWPLDLLPTILTTEEWKFLDAAVSQRARLLNLVLSDLYGPQKLVNRRLLPPELLYAHPGFLRPCKGMEPAGGNWLTVYAADLARSPDGSWWILGERTEVPTGPGYALENRLIVSRTLPEAFDATGVVRLASYFQRHRETLGKSAPGHRENPRIVLLTPGAEAETYFEHAFLARYLGYSLVEGPDLLVRDRKVFLKTLGGLLPVDMILRRQASDACDPVEFPSGSVAGAPGLLEAVRAGNVGVANAIGSGVVESPALLAFLPVLARELLQEDLLVPSVATWWCGQDDARKYVLENLERLVIKPSFPGLVRERLFGSHMAPAELDKLRRKIEQNPVGYAAQEEIPLSTAPVRTARGLEPRFMVIRAFAVQSGDSYTLMPGGLARVSASTDTFDVSVHSGGSSKDLWVVGDSEQNGVSLLPTTQHPIDVSRATFDLPSRVAGNLYWMGRYAERIDAAARFIRATVPLVFDESSRRGGTALAGAVAFLAGLGYARPEAADVTISDDALEQEIRWAVSDSDRRGSFGWQIHQLHRVGRLLRDRLSGDAWRIISRLESDFMLGQIEIDEEHGLSDLLDSVVVNLSSFSGAVNEGMTRGHGWRLLDIGRRIERALRVIDLLRNGLVEVPEDEPARVELLLDAADSVITYRSRYLVSLQADLTIDLLVIDDANPRSVAFQLELLRGHVGNLPEIPSQGGRLSPATRRVTDAVSAIQLADLDALERITDGRREGLEALLDRLSDDLAELSDDLTRDYLTHATLSRQLARR